MAASKTQRRKVGKVLGEHKRGSLRSGSGGKVKSRKQAVAIAMSESGQSRRKKSSAKRSTAKRTTSRSRKTSRKTASRRKTSARKTAKRKTSSRRGKR